MIKKRIAAVSFAVAIVVSLLTVPVLAGNRAGGHTVDNFGQNVTTERPGWGYGDTNHTHTGPPGLFR